jgi:hypothetical protein
MSVRQILLAATTVWIVAFAMTPASAQTVRYANQGELKSLDPYTLNESTTHGHLGNVYEGLIARDKDLKIIPALAESWEIKEDPSHWRFHLRKGVKFHDGSDFNADAAIWNLDRYFKKDAKQFDPPGGAVAQARNPFVAGYRKIDDNTIEFTNPRPLSYFPNMLPYMLYSSPAQFEKTGSWAEFAKSPSGTGPVNPADLSHLDPDDPSTYKSGYPPHYTDPTKNPVNVDISSKGFANFTAQDNLPALMYNNAILDIHGGVNISGVVYSPSFMEIENHNKTQYFKGALIGGGGIYVENGSSSPSIVSYDAKAVSHLATAGTRGKAVIAIYRQ